MRPGPVARGIPALPGAELSAQRRGASRSGVAPCLLLDVQTPLGEVFYWSDRDVRKIAPVLTAGIDSPTAKIATIAWDSGVATIVFAKPCTYVDGITLALSALTVATDLNALVGTIVFATPTDRKTITLTPAAPFVHADIAAIADAGIVTVMPPALVNYVPWLISSAALNLNRSLKTDTGSLSVQNISGDTLQRDFERIVRRSVLEGSLFVLRYYSVDMEWTWLEQHGTLSAGDAGAVVQLNLQQLLGGSDNTPVEAVSETCQLVWGEKRCGATGDTECLYSYASCQVPERFVGIQSAFEVNNPEAAAVLPTTIINRKRAW